MMMMIIMPYTIRNPSLHPMLQLYNWIISIPVRELFRAIIPHLSISTISGQVIATAHYPQPSLIAVSIWFDFHSALALYSSIISFVSFFFRDYPTLTFLSRSHRQWISCLWFPIFFILGCFCFRRVSSSCARGFGVVVLSRPIDGGDDSGGDSKLLLSLSPLCWCDWNARRVLLLPKLSREFSNILIQLWFFFA